jgi:tRNA nucleotidyltransferase (CCA-adding enzyme)
MKKAIEVCEKVKKEIRPTEEEIEKLKKVEKKLLQKLDRALKETPFITPKILGSYSRGTWLRGAEEIDLFLLFPLDFEEKEMESLGVEIGKKVLENYVISYAEHPYVKGDINGIPVEVVPCFRISNASEIKSAVDRTPLHHEFLRARIRGMEDEVRLLKQFLKASGLYGAEYKIRGFSGYLCELLILYYGSFLQLVDRARYWNRRLIIDLLNGVEKKGESFTVVDPVDPDRNVAANLSIDSMAKFVEKCRSFMENPDEEFFFPEKRIPISREMLLKEIEKRNTALLIIEFARPNVVDDVLYPQLDKALSRIVHLLDSQDFQVMRSNRLADEKACYLFVECIFKTLPVIKKKTGPPFDLHENAKEFLKKYENTSYVPFLEDGRYYVYVERKFTTPEECIVNNLDEMELGRHVTIAIRDGYAVYSGKDIMDVVDSRGEEFAKFLMEFMSMR